MIAAAAIWLLVDADIQRKKAEAQRQQAQLAQSRYLGGFAMERLQQGHLDKAVGLAREALPVDLSRPDRPVAPEALTALYNTYAQKRFGLRSLRGHAEAVLGALQLQDGSLLTWSKDMTARLWAKDGTPGLVLEGHKGQVAGVLQLRDSCLLTWGSEDKSPRLWATDGTLGPVLQGHMKEVSGALPLQDGRLLTWSGDDTPRVWATDGAPGPVLEHERGVLGALQLQDGRLLTWGRDNTAPLWAVDGAPGPLLEHENTVSGALQLRDGRLLTWSTDAETVRLWPLVEQLLIWADRYIEDLGPLLPVERCQYYLEPDTACNRAAQ